MKSYSIVEPMVNHLSGAYVKGRWLEPAGANEVEVVNPATERVIAHVRQSGVTEVDAAVAAAQAAFGDWATTSPRQRADALRAIAKGLRDRQEELALTITEDVGTPIEESRRLQVGQAVNTFSRTADLLDNVQMHERVGNSLITRVPLGVVGCITPWNYPLYLMATKVAPAIAAGCTVVVKPSELAPLGPLKMAEVVDAARLPLGVFNLVVGSGAIVGEAITRHREIDAVSFTGSTTTGRHLAAAAGAGIKHLSLELGGKSPSIVLGDGDIASAVAGTLAKCFQNSGQTCAALTVLLVPQDRLPAVEEIAVECCRQYEPGDPQIDATRLGPVASEAQRRSVVAHIESGLKQGARLLTGGQAPNTPARGYYIQPTVFSGVAPEMTIAREEIFGPVLSIVPFKRERDAVEIANRGDYGLSAAVWSADEERADHVARQLRAGSISLNGASTNPDAPFGGFKLSGFGRERGRFGIEGFLTTTAVHR